MHSLSNTDWRASAEANLRAVSKRNGRIGSKKSRAGCLSCKSRRIKCDEKRPVCEKCSHSGRLCSYEKSPTLPDDESLSTSGGSSSGHSSHTCNELHALIRPLSQSPIQGQDNRPFEYFISWAAPRLAGSLDKDFWCGKVLVHAQTESVLRDAILALSVLYEHPQFMRSFLDRPNLRSAGYVDEHHARALRYYNRSISALRGHQLSPSLALLSCVLFIAVELIRDNVFAALSLLHRGAQLLRQMPICPTGMDGGLFLTIKLMMSRLGVLAAVYGHPTPFRMMSRVEKDNQGPDFMDLIGARAALSLLMGDIFSNEPEHVKKSSTADHGSKSTMPTEDTEVIRIHYGCKDERSSPLESNNGTSFPTGSLHLFDQASIDQASSKRQARLTDRLVQWYVAFRKIQTADSETACGLLMLYHISFVAVSTQSSKAQTIFDRYTHSFEEILRLAKTFLECKRTQHTTFAFEVGALGPLYYVATKCRIPSLRRRAIQLMSLCPAKESTFGAKSVAELAAKLVAIEEEHLSLPNPQQDRSHLANDLVLPQEHDRVHDYELILNRSDGRHDVRVTRFRVDATGHFAKFVLDYPM